MNTKDQKEKWICEYIAKNGPVDVLNADFVDAFVERFNSKMAIMLYGANKCPEIGRLLSKMYRQGTLERGRVGIWNRLSGFPAWVYVYQHAKQSM